MDMDFWGARLQRQIPVSSVTSSRDDHTGVEDGGEDIRAWFPCPFCYMEIELPLFCLHLQQEHCFDFKNAVCPICAANLGKDALSHFRVQHAHSIKRRKTSRKSGFWSNVSADIVKDLKELSSFLGIDSLKLNNDNGNATAPDPLLLPFLGAVPKDAHQDAASLLTAANSAESTRSSQDAVEEEDVEEKRKRAAFLHELLYSAVFST